MSSVVPSCSILVVVWHSTKADRMNTSQIRIPSQCGSAVVAWRSYMCIPLAKYCFNCHLQVVDLNHLIEGSNPELPFQAVFIFMGKHGMNFLP